MSRVLKRELSQDDVRFYLAEVYDIRNEIFLKYVYDGYTHAYNYRAIRKPKTRKKIAHEFHSSGYSKQLAQQIVKEL